MELQITARHFDIVEPLKEFSREKIMPLKHYFNKIMRAHLILSPEGPGYSAELTIKGKKANFIAHSKADTLNAAIEDVACKIERQLKEKKRKLNRRSRQKPEPLEM